jgi:O-antigen/teichoic acid export membrane protein
MSVTEPIHAGSRRVVLDIAVQIFARVGNLILGIFVTLILVRGLGPHGFGYWSAIFAVGQIATGIGELGLNGIAISRAARDPGHERDWIGALLSLRLLLAVPITVGSMLAVVLIAPTGDAQLAGVIISCTLAVGAPGALGIIFQLRVRNDIPMVIMTFNSILWGVGVGAVALLSGGIVAFSAVFLATAILTAILTFVLARRMTPVKLRGVRHLWRPMLRIGVPAGIGAMMVTFYVKLDQILVLDIAGAKQAGLYGAAYRLLEQIQFIPAVVMTTMFPLIAAAYGHQRARALYMFQATAEYLAMASLPIVAFTIVAAKPIVLLLFGSEFAGAAKAVPMLAGAFVSISFGYLVGNMVVVLELQRRFVTFAAIALVLNVGLNVLLIPSYGFVAAAWITLLTEFTVMSLSMRMVLKGLAMRPQLGRFAKMLAAAVFMGLSTWLVRLAGMPLSVLVLVAAITYLPSLLALKAISLTELRQLLARKPPVPAEG